MDEVEQYYDSNVLLEWQRFDRHRTEFAITLRAMSEYLPEPPAPVLDLGGGPGRYAIELARRGYQVTLADLSSENLVFARQKSQELSAALDGFVHANALRLDEAALPRESYDVVLLMGPLYHLLEPDERKQAVRLALRRLKPGGLMLASFITRYSPFRDAARRDPLMPVIDREYALQLLRTGRHDQPGAPNRGFTRAYFAHPDEVAPLMEGCGLKTLALIGCEGVAAGREEEINQLSGEPWEAWVEINYAAGRDPSMRGASDHLLFIGRKADD